jgi:hypothetical protein
MEEHEMKAWGSMGYLGGTFGSMEEHSVALGRSLFNP